MQRLEFINVIHESADKITVIKKMKDIDNERFIAVKEINKLDRISQLFFDREINALKKLNNHPNIVKMYGYDVEHNNEENSDIGKVFLEYIQGEDLSVIDLRLIELRDKYSIIYQIVDAIEIAHSNSIIHRDIKPANVMIIDYQKVKLIDFGISKIKGMITSDTIGTVANFATNRYTAPEVRYHNDNSSFKSDIYSLGATIYYLMTGNHPPLPNEFVQCLMNTSGISEKLRDIIIKAVSVNPDDRYESITDLKRDIDIVLKDLMRSSKIVISVPTDIFLSAKHKKMIPSAMTQHEFISSRLKEWFRDSYAFIDTPLKGTCSLSEEHRVSIFGSKYILKCLYKDYEEYFLVEELKPIDQKVRNELVNTYMYVNSSFDFYSSQNLKIEALHHQTNEFVNELIDHRINYESDSNKQNKFDKFFGAWIEYLEAEKELIKTNSTKVHYRSRNYLDNGTIELELSNLSIDELDFNQETVLIYDPTLNNIYTKKSTIITVGAFQDYRFEDDKVYMVLKRIKGDTKKIPSAGGTIVTDYKTLIFVIEKQLKALWLLRKNECECNENLRDLILGFEKPTSINNFENIEFYNVQLDYNQREAVKIALCTSSVCVIQGPPGTGKTSVIREIINQILRLEHEDYGQKRFRILIVSQSHTAVDHMLEGLIQTSNEETKVIRIGSDENIIDSIWEKYSVEKAHESWNETIIKSSNKRIMELLNSYEIEIDEFNEYCRAFNTLNPSDKEKEIISNFEEKYLCDMEKRLIIETALIQNDWVNRVRLSKDSKMRLIENSTIVAGTCTGFNSNPIVKNMKFDFVIIDEAAKASVPELLVPLLKGSRMILVGDHHQLPPMLKDNVIKKCEGIRKTDLESGLFEHLYDSFPYSNKIRLEMQYRMHEIIGKMISEVFYNNTIETGVKSSDREHKLNCFKNKSIVWVSSSNIPKEKRKDKEMKGKSFKNYCEVKLIKKILSDIDKEPESANYEIAIITGYSAQKNSLLEETKRMSFNNIKDLEINTVDAYQGRDKDIVIFSTVRSNDIHEIGFQKSQKRINVAFSRARRLIIIVGDHEHFYNNNHPTNSFPAIINYINNNERCSIEYAEVTNERR